MIFFGFYHWKSPLNHHLGDNIFFQAFKQVRLYDWRIFFFVFTSDKHDFKQGPFVCWNSGDFMWFSHFFSTVNYSSIWPDEMKIHPGKFTWNIIMEVWKITLWKIDIDIRYLKIVVWKIIFLFNWVISGEPAVDLQGCIKFFFLIEGNSIPYNVSPWQKFNRIPAEWDCSKFYFIFFI